MPATDMPMVVGQDGKGLTAHSSVEAQIVDVDATSQSLPNSQSSNSAESTASQLSQNHFASQNTSQSSLDHATQIDTEREAARILSASVTAPRTAVPAYPQDPTQTFKGDKAKLQPILPALDVGQSVQGSYRTNGAHGQKRTASGHVKTPSSSQTTSPVDAMQFGHSRRHSTTSSSHQIGELSAQLKTRLSYAMVKVQNGWQTKTIDEVESLASQHGSPISATGSPRQPFASPRTNMMQIYSEKAGFAESSERSTAPQERGLTAPHLHQGTSSRDHAYLQRPHAPHSPKPHSIDHPNHPNGTNPQHPRSLAPPVDFSTRHPRRSNPSHTAQPLNSRNTSNLSASSTSSTHSTIPATPPQSKRPPAIKTPSQKTTAMEKDAIESLLFMSSPGNSQRHPNHAGQLASPLRSAFLPAEKHVGFVAVNAREVGLQGRRMGGLRGGGKGSGIGRLETDENIEKALDEMGEGDSSDEEEGGMLAVGVVS